MNNDLGELRRSSVVMMFAPGAVVDFRADGAPVSAVVAGLDEWDASFPPAGLANPQVIFEPRLQRKLGVDGFRLPPVTLDSLTPGSPSPDNGLVAVRFPSWLQCPKCDEIAPARKWGQEPGRAYRYCAPCSAKEPGGRRVAVIPVRFVLACTAGHLDEFPWHFWIQHDPGCANNKPDGKLTLRTEHAGLSGLMLSCKVCRRRRSMDGIFGRETFNGLRCRALRPWLDVYQDPGGCHAGPDELPPQVRAVQRGSSNLYFPAIQSALDIPPWSDQLQQTLGVYWSGIVDVEDPEERKKFIQILARGPLGDVLAQLRMTPDQLAATLAERLSGLQATEGEDIRLDEYRKLSSGIDSEGGSGQEFEIRNEQVDGPLTAYLSRLVRVTRLREVRALTGFTRIYPPEAEEQSGLAPLSSRRKRWLPAIEVRGEGIFLALEKRRLLAWEQDQRVTSRINVLASAAEEDWKSRHPDSPFSADVSPRFVLLHVLAHALIRQLTLECGYSTAALRERLYCSGGESGMCGILIYTSTPDADGTLGGLQRQGTKSRFQSIFINAIRAMEWCSSDPLCMEDAIGGVSSLSLAACHACCLAPETSCEHYNRFLDRALLLGTPGEPTLGYFENV